MDSTTKHAILLSHVVRTSGISQAQTLHNQVSDLGYQLLPIILVYLQRILKGTVEREFFFN